MDPNDSEKQPSEDAVDNSLSDEKLAETDTDDSAKKEREAASADNQDEQADPIPQPSTEEDNDKAPDTNSVTTPGTEIVPESENSSSLSDDSAAAAEHEPPKVPGPSEESKPEASSSSEPVISMAEQAPATALPSSLAPKRRRRKLPWAIAVVVIIIIAALGYTFAIYIPNTPSGVYKSSLANTGKALDKLISYTKTQDTKRYQSVSFNGTLKLKSAEASLDASLNGAFDKSGNGSAQIKADIMGGKLTADIKSVKAEGNTSPDIYVKLSGIKDYLDQNGLEMLDDLDGQWVSIDHTLVDTYQKALKSGVDSDTDTNLANASGAPTIAQINDAIDKVQTVNKQYIFTTDKSKAVLTNEKFVAKDTQNGRSVNHYTVGYNKANLQAYADALQKALDSSQLNDWSKKANDGKNLSEVMDFESLKDSIKNAKSDYTFDLWADTKTKLVSKVQFTDPSDKSSVFAISQDYTGGNKYPLALSFSGKDDVSGDPETGILNITVDTDSNKYTGKFTMDEKGSDPMTLNAAFTLTPSSQSVQVTAPSASKSINDVLSELGLGGLLDTTTTTSDNSTTSFGDSGTFVLTQ